MVVEQVDFTGFLGWFESIGGFDFILPFLLIFAIVFAILEQIKLFGAKRNISAILALIIALFAVIQTDVVLLIQGFIPRVSMIILFIFSVLLLIGIFGVRAEKFAKLPFGIAVILSIIGVIWAFGAASGWDVPWGPFLTQEDIAIILTLGIFILIIWFIIKEPPKETEQRGVRKFFGDLFDLGQGKEK